RQDEEAAAVGRPFELQRAAEVRPGLQPAMRVGVDDPDLAAGGGVSENVAATGARLPGRRDRRGARERLVVGAVSPDDPELAAAPVGDPVALVRRPPRVADPVPLDRQPQLALRVDRSELATGGDGDVEAVWRPARLRVLAEQALRPIRVDDPGTG